MVSLTSELTKWMWCNGISLVYGLPAILSMLFATLLMMTDFIIPCVTNKKVMNLTMLVQAQLHILDNEQAYGWTNPYYITLSNCILKSMRLLASYIIVQHTVYSAHSKLYHRRLYMQLGALIFEDHKVCCLTSKTFIFDFC